MLHTRSKCTLISATSYLTFVILLLLGLAHLFTSYEVITHCHGFQDLPCWSSVKVHSLIVLLIMISSTRSKIIRVYMIDMHKISAGRCISDSSDICGKYSEKCEEKIEKEKNTISGFFMVCTGKVMNSLV